MPTVSSVTYEINHTEGFASPEVSFDTEAWEEMYENIGKRVSIILDDEFGEIVVVSGSKTLFKHKLRKKR